MYVNPHNDRLKNLSLDELLVNLKNILRKNIYKRDTEGYVDEVECWDDIEEIMENTWWIYHHIDETDRNLSQNEKKDLTDADNIIEFARELDYIS